MTGYDMEKTTPPERGADPDGTCMTCRHCIEECCDMGLCGLRAETPPSSFASWWEALDYMDGCRVDMQTDVCGEWEEQ